MKRKLFNLLVPALFVVTLGPVLDVTAAGDLRTETETAIKNLQSADSTLTNLLNTSAGYAVFPWVGKGGALFLAPSMETGWSMSKARPLEQPQ